MTYIVKEKIKSYFKSLDEEQKDVLEAYKLFCFMSFFISSMFQYHVILTTTILVGFAVFIPCLYTNRNKAVRDKETKLITCKKRDKSFLDIKENRAVSSGDILIAIMIIVSVFFILHCFSVSLSNIIPVVFFVIITKMYLFLFSRKLPFSIMTELDNSDHTDSSSDTDDIFRMVDDLFYSRLPGNVYSNVRNKD